MKVKRIGILLAGIIVCAASVSVMLGVVLRPGAPAEFVPPAFEEAAEGGSPEVPDGLGYSLLEVPSVFTAFVCGRVIPENGAADIYFTNNPANEVWLRLRVLDMEGNILGETGLLKPNEYVRSVALKEVPPVGTEIQLKVMAYEPETYHSAGAVTLNTTIAGGE